MNSSRRTRILKIVIMAAILILALGASALADSGPPPLPAFYSGTVVDSGGSPVAVGTIKAYIEGVLKGEQALSGGTFTYLVVDAGDIALSGKPVTFMVEIAGTEYSATVTPSVNWYNSDIQEGLLVRLGGGPTVPVTGISVSPTSLNLTAGGVAGSLTATVTPANASNKSVLWQSSNPTIANVSNGTVTPLSAGSVDVTVTTADGGFSAVCTVNVAAAAVPVTGVNLSPANLTLNVGGSPGVLSATVLPVNASNKMLSWSSSDPTVASVSGGIVTPVSTGYAVVTVTTAEGGFTASSQITVLPSSGPYIKVDSAVIHEAAANDGSITEKQYLTLFNGYFNDNIYSADVSINNLPPGLAYSIQQVAGSMGTRLEIRFLSKATHHENINDVAAASIKIRAEKIVGAEQDVTSEPFAFDFNDAVYVPVSGISLSPASLTVNLGANANLTAAISPVNASNKAVNWVSADPAIATVSATGQVKGIAIGKTVITATTADGGFSATAAVEVKSSALPLLPAIYWCQVRWLNGDPLNEGLIKAFVLSIQRGQLDVSQAAAGNPLVVSGDSSTTNRTVVFKVIYNGKEYLASPNQGVAWHSGEEISGLILIIDQPSAGVPVTGVSLNRSSCSLDQGASISLQATVLPLDATDQRVNWSSSNPAVAAVSGSGVVSANAPGQAVITATTVDGGFTAVCTVEVLVPVVNVTSVQLNRGFISLFPGGSEQLTVTIYPANATNQAVQWASSQPTIAAVDQNGLISALSPGNCTVSVTTVDGGKFASCAVTVLTNEVPVTSVILDRTSIVGIEGDPPVQLHEQVLPANASNKAVTWQSSNPAVASVSAGLVSLHQPGMAVITVTTQDGAKTASCTVQVNAKPIPVTSVSLDRNELLLTPGQSGLLTATVYPANASNRSVQWRSDNPLTAMVDANGMVTAVATGTCLVTATTVDGGKTAFCLVTVVAQTSITITVSPAVLHEAAANDGSIQEAQILTAVGGMFDENLTASDIKTNNLPAGLQIMADTRYPGLSRNQVRIVIMGRAVAHSNADDVSGVSYTISANRVLGASTAVTSEPFAIDFNDPSGGGGSGGDTGLRINASVTDGTVTMATGDQTVSSTDRSWILKLTTGLVKSGVSAANLSVSGLPAGLSYSAGKGSSNSIIVTVTGTALQPVSTPVDISIVVKSSAVSQTTLGNSEPLWVQLKPSGAAAPAPVLTAAPLTIHESAANDGSLAGTLTIGLLNAMFAADLDGKTVLNNLPAGLGYSVTRVSASQLLVSFSGNALQHGNSADINNLTLTVAASGIIGATGNLVTNPVAIDFDDPGIVAVTGVTVSPAALTLTLGGGDGVLSAAVQPVNASNKAVVWSSSDPAVAVVNNGTVAPLAIGTCTITATTVDGGKSATCAVTVLGAGAPTLKVGSPLIKESLANDGSVVGKQIVTISNGLFDNFISNSDVIVNNLPAGLSYTAERVAGTMGSLLEVTFLGRALNHANSNDVGNASITVKKERILGATADVTSDLFGFDFEDPAPGPAPLNRIVAVATDAQVTLAAGNTTVSAGDRSWVVRLTTGTVKSGVSAANLTLVGLPPGLTVSAGKGSMNSIVITLAGTLAEPITAPLEVGVIVKASAVTQSTLGDSALVSVLLQPAA